MRFISTVRYKSSFDLIVLLHFICSFTYTSSASLVDTVAEKLQFFDDVKNNEYVQKDVIYIIGGHEHFVRDACYLVSADTFTSNISKSDYGSEKSEACISNVLNNKVRIATDNSKEYVINKITNYHQLEAREIGRFDPMLQLERDVVLAKRIKFYFLIQINESFENIFKTISFALSSLGDVEKYIDSTSIYLIDYSIKPYQNINNKFWKLNEVREEADKNINKFMSQLENKIKLIPNNIQFVKFYNQIARKNSMKKYEKVGILFVPTDLFPNWVRFLYFNVKSKFIEIDVSSLGMFLEVTDNYSPKPYFYAMVKMLFLTLSSETKDNVIYPEIENMPYLPRIKRLTATLSDYMREKSTIPFCMALEEVLSKFQIINNQKIIKLCKRAQFVGNRIEMRDLKYEFADFDSFHLMNKCQGYVQPKNFELSVLTDKYATEFDQNEVCILSNEYSELFLSYSRDFLSKDYCLNDLSFHELFYLYFKGVSAELIVEKFNGTCIFSGNTVVMKKVLSYESCSSKIVRAKIAVFQEENFKEDIKVYTPILINYKGNCEQKFALPYLPSLESKACMQISFNVINGAADRQDLREYLMFLTSNMVCVGNKYMIDMINDIAFKLVNQYNFTTNELIEDYRFFFEKTNKTNSIGLELYAFHINNLIDAKKNNMNWEKKTVFQNTLIAYESLLTPIKAQNNLIIDLQGFLSIIDSEILNLRQIKEQNNRSYTQDKHMKKIELATDNYQEKLTYTIKEIQIVQKRLGINLNEHLNKNVKSLENVIKELEVHEKHAETKVNTLIEKRKSMIAHLAFSVYFGAMTVIGGLISICVPPVGAALMAVGSVGSAINKATTVNYDTSYKIPSNVLYEFKKIEYQIESSLDMEIKSLKKSISKFKTSVSEILSYEQVILSDIEYKIKMIEESRNSSSFSILISAKEKFDTLKFHERQKRSISINSRPSLQVVTSQRQKRQDKIEVTEEDASKGATEAANAVGSVIEKGMEMSSEIPSEAEIEEARKDLERIRKFKNKIFSEIIPLVISFNQYMGNTTGSLENLSKPLLIEMNYFMKHKFRIIIQELMDISKGMESNKDIQRNAEELHDVLQTIFLLHDEIKNVEHEKGYINLLKTLTSPVMNEHVIQDKMLQNFVMELRNGIASVNIYREVEKLMFSIKMWLFPFASKFFPGKLILENLNSFQAISGASFDTYVEAYGNLKQKINTYHVEIVPQIDQNIHEVGNGSKSLDEMYNFYTWNRKQYGVKINELLDEKEVLMTAKIPNPKDVSADAIKFSSAYLYFTCETEDICKQFYNTINMTYHISLTHMGYSQYRCGTNYYTINTGKVTIDYIITASKYVTNQNALLKKLEKGNILLSPYTPWLLALIPTEKKYTKDLSIFKNKIDIHLVGKGQYVKDVRNKIPICSPTILNKYYFPAENVN